MRFSNLTTQQSLLGTRFCNYVPAVLKHSDSPNLGWFIEFFCADMSDQKMKRYRIKMNSLFRTSVSERDFALQANNVVSELNQNLYHGWVPNRTTMSADTMYQSMAMQSNPMRQMMYAQACQPMVQFVTNSGGRIQAYAVNNNAPIVYTEPAPMPTIVATPPMPTANKRKAATPEVAPMVTTVEPTPIVVDPIEEPIVEPMPELPNDIATETETMEDNLSSSAVDPMNITIKEMMKEFMAEREETSRPTTIRSYKTFVKSMETFLDEKYPNLRCNEFNIRYAKEFIKWKENSMKETKDSRNSKTKYGVSDRSVNNVIKGMRLVWGYAVEMQYTDDNPFVKIKTRKITSKRRELVDKETLTEIEAHLRENNQKGFLLVCMLLYNTFLRPNEIRQLQVKDIHLFEHKIILPGEAAKNKYDRTVGITEDIEKLIVEMGIYDAKSTDYLIGKDFKINKTMCPEHDYRIAWSNLRDELNLPEEMQLYSLKDTGITDMLESGVATIDVMKQAGHHDLRITTRYANHEDKNLASKMHEKGLKFSK